MRWTVVWRNSALDDLAAIWLNATDRRAVTEAANRIDQTLRTDADQKGEDFYGDRLYVDGPLAVTFSVNADDCIVRVLQVWAVR
jgi:hypothetical protein